MIRHEINYKKNWALLVLKEYVLVIFFEGDIEEEWDLIHDEVELLHELEI